MAIYYAPGVYIEEPDRGPKPIEGVSTSVTAFIGYTEKAEDYIENEKPMKKSLLSTAKTITSWTQYVEHFGSYKEGAYLPFAVRGFFENGGQRCYVISVRTLGEPMRAQALVKANHQISKQSTPYLFVRAKDGGPVGENIKVTIEPTKMNGTDKFKLIVNGTKGTATLDDIALGDLPHWDLRDARLSEIDQAIKSRRVVVDDSDLIKVEEEARQTAQTSAIAARRAKTAREVLNQMESADKKLALQKANERVDSAMKGVEAATKKAQDAIAASDQAAKDAATKANAHATASANLNAKANAKTSAKTPDEAQKLAEEAVKATLEADAKSKESVLANEFAKRKAIELVQAKNAQTAAEKDLEAAKATQEKAEEAARAAETAKLKTAESDAAKSTLDEAEKAAKSAADILEKAEKGTDETKKNDARTAKDDADTKVKDAQATFKTKSQEAQIAEEEKSRKAVISIDEARKRLKDADIEAETVAKLATEAADKLAKMNLADSVLIRTLGRAYDSDMINDKLKFDKLRKTYTALSDIGVEIWRGVETNRPVRLAFEKETAQLEIKDGFAFNVDIDPKLLVALDDQDELQKAKQADQRFDIVRPEQYMGYDRKGLSALEALDDVNLLCAPDIMQLPYESQRLTVQKKMIEHCERMQFRFAILDAPIGKNVDGIKDWRMNAGFDPQHGHAALYYPWLKIDDPLNPGQTKAIPPCGHIAGIYSRSDAQRGVHKAPANETVNGVIELELNVNQAEQGMLNPIGINCIRKFPGRGIKVWGARTLALTDPSWRYVNVRRLFNFVEASIERATQWVVFEPNDQILWGKIRRDVNAFMRTVWLSGALFGNTPDEAFYVKCDEELNPADTRDQGYLFVEIGLAPVKPAEFVVFRISQWAGPNAEG